MEPAECWLIYNPVKTWFEEVKNTTKSLNYMQTIWKESSEINSSLKDYQVWQFEALDVV